MSDFVIENGILKQYTGSKRSVIVPEGVTEIAEGVFREGGMTVPSRYSWTRYMWIDLRKKGSLRSVQLPSTLKVIRANAFRECSALRRVELPEGLEEISALAFFGCEKLKEITIPAGNPAYETVDGVLFLKKEKKLICYPAGKEDRSYAIPEGTEAVGSNAFSVTAALKEIRIPASVLRIEDRAFVGPKPLPGLRNTDDMIFRSVIVAPGGKKKQVGKDVLGFEDGRGPLYYPELPVDFVREKKIRDRLAIGFCSKPDLYAEPYREGYETYVKEYRKSLMQKALSLKLDAVMQYFGDEMEETYETLSEQAKVELLEKVILEGDKKKLESLLRAVPSFAFGARALGYACLYSGAEITELLLDHGLSFEYKKTPYLSGRYKLSYRTQSNTYYADYSLLAVYKGIDPRIDVLFGGERDLHFANMPIDEKRILPDEERLRCVRLLAERAVLGVRLPDLLYYSVLWGCRPVEHFLRKRGVRLPGWAKFALTRAGYSVERGEFLAVLAGSPAEVTVHCLESLTEQLAADHQTIVLTMKLFDIDGSVWEKDWKTCVWDDAVLSRIIRLTDTSRLTKSTLLNGAIEHNCIETLTAMETAGWLKNPVVRDKLIDYAQQNRYREALAWLLDFKNRTADLAAEEAAREKRELRSLNANPDSVSELKKIWLYAVDEEGHATIRGYKGGDIDVIVPQKIGKAVVTEIGTEAFAAYAYQISRVKNSETRKRLRSVCLPDSITSIEKGAFRGCENLESVNIPDSVQWIGPQAFEGCTKLPTLEVPEGARIHSSTSGWKNAAESVDAYQYGPKVCVRKKRKKAAKNGA